jgi:membrane metallo-endopeptidase-like protein 1
MFIPDNALSPPTLLYRLQHSCCTQTSYDLSLLHHLFLAAQIRKLGDAPLRDVLASLGGWPVTQPNWQPPEFSVETLLGRLRGQYNEGVLIEQWVGPDDKNSSVNILQVRTK